MPTQASKVPSNKIALKADDPGVKDSKFIEYIGKEAFEAAGHVNRVTELEELGTYVFDNMDGNRNRKNGQFSSISRRIRHKGTQNCCNRKGR